MSTPSQNPQAAVVKILIVDDDPKIRTFLTRGLSESGMVCEAAPDGESALARLRSQKFDLVLLDVMLPGIQGWDVLEALRADGISVPVIWVTARDALDERVRGLQMGGDDYVVKPFAFSELLARVHAVLRRRRESTVTRMGDIEIDHLRGVVTRAGSVLDLTRTEFSLLLRLVESWGRSVSRSELLSSVWGIDFDPGTNVVDVHIRRLRKKLDEPFDVALIHTVRGAGYVIGSQD